MDSDAPTSVADTSVAGLRIATGGEGVARLEDGCVIFVPGLLPGETAEVRVTERRKRFARGEIVNLTAASAHRQEPDCALVARGCGGCDWRHIEAAVQPAWKADVVRDVLTRIARLEDPEVIAGAPLEGYQGRTTVRALVHNGRGAYRARKSHRAVVAEECPAAHPQVEEILTDSRFGGAEEVTIRVGEHSGEAIVIVSPTVEDVDVPPGVAVIGTDDVDAGRNAWITEPVGAVSWRVSAASFFQSSSTGAAALAEVVGRALADAPDGPMVDAYGGVGLLGGLLAGDRPLTIVESSTSSAADARVNVPMARVIEQPVESWHPQPAAVVIADPARSGLKAEAVEVLSATGASHLALVSCDAGALGRDAGLLVQAGWTFVGSEVVDLFPNTSHIEAVSRFVR